MSLPVLDADFIETLTTADAVCRKQEMGLYPLETVPCYCGASSPVVLAETDRYAMRCRTNLCSSCGLVYVSPRMTAAAYQSFYEQDYRKIYHTEDDHNALIALQNGEAIWSCCEFYDCLPSSVIDIGCGKGGLLRAFVQKGLRAHGVDQDATAIAEGLAVGLPIEVGDAQLLIDRGVTADLVILHHVLEHCLDLPATLAQMRQLLTPNGVLFIAVPGIHATPIRRLFQTAHVYHFTADTLEYVMQCEGWRALMLGEQVHSIWKPTHERRDKTDYSPDAARVIWDTMGANPTKIHELRTYNKFPVKLQRENVQAVLASGIPDLRMIRNTEAGHAAVIIGGGPSVDQQVTQIRLLQATGCKLVAIERMASWCEDHEIVPDYLAILDASEDVPSSLQYVHPRTVCITATQCGQAVVDVLHGKRAVYCYSCPSGTVNLPALFEHAVHDKLCVLNAGGSVTLSAMTIAMVLGMSSLHIFGFDCHVNRDAYATGITGVGVDAPRTFDVEIESQVYRTTGAYLSFAQQFFPLMETARLGGYVTRVQVYGDSLVTAMGSEFIADLNRRGEEL
jgi:SAM-dependent methyltransferase